jgi:hypothetical protein
MVAIGLWNFLLANFLPADFGFINSHRGGIHPGGF